MKNIILTASIVINVFTGALAYSFATGVIARNSEQNTGYVSELVELHK